MSSRRSVRLAVLAAALASLAACTSSGSTGAGTSAASSPGSSPASAASPGTDPAYTKPEVAAAAAIPGVVHKVEPAHNHVLGPVQYDTTPPTGGDHSAYWADCTGTVYPQAIANENAVHMLEHGAVWLTYRDGLDAADVAALSRLVSGQDHTAMSPYPGLKAKVSLQAWGYQLFTDNVNDPRIAQFIKVLRSNPGVAPEVGGECPQPTFLQHPSTFGHPLNGPAS